MWAQTESPTDAKFEVASIRPTPAGERSSSTHTNNGNVRTHNTSVARLIQLAYDVQDYQVIGGPGWAQSEGYDINAKFDSDAEKDESAATRDRLLRARAKNLLAERFQLKLREDTKELPIYVIIAAKGGLRLKPSEQSGQSMNTNRSNSAGKITATGAKLDGLADVLGNILRRPVRNETGLDGRFDFELTWTSDEGLDAVDAAGPSIFTALQEQAGLKLESKKGPVRMLVIEQLERPSEN
jgi:bla regulator protein blaR1